MNGRDKLKLGDFNHMSQEKQDDGSILVVLSSRKYPEIYRFKVRNLYQINEKVISNEVFERKSL